MADSAAILEQRYIKSAHTHRYYSLCREEEYVWSSCWEGAYILGLTGHFVICSLLCFCLALSVSFFPFSLLLFVILHYCNGSLLYQLQALLSMLSIANHPKLTWQANMTEELYLLQINSLVYFYCPFTSLFRGLPRRLWQILFISYVVIKAPFTFIT